MWRGESRLSNVTIIYACVELDTTINQRERGSTIQQSINQWERGRGASPSRELGRSSMQRLFPPLPVDPNAAAAATLLVSHRRWLGTCMIFFVVGAY